MYLTGETDSSFLARLNWNVHIFFFVCSFGNFIIFQLPTPKISKTKWSNQKQTRKTFDSMLVSFRWKRFKQFFKNQKLWWVVVRLENECRHRSSVMILEIPSTQCKWRAKLKIWDANSSHSKLANFKSNYISKVWIYMLIYTPIKRYGTVLNGSNTY